MSIATLTDHLNATRRLLRDGAADYWSDADLIAHINDGIKQRDLDTKQNTLVQAVPLVAGQNEYTINMGGFSARTIAVMTIIIIWGNARTRLAERPYGEAASIYQPTTAVSMTPKVWAKLSPSVIYLAPAPNQAYSAEWHTAIVSADLVNGTDADPLPYPWTEPVKFYAASMARLQLQQYDEHEKYKQLYQQNLAEIADGVLGQYVPYPYPMSRSRY